MSNHTTSASEDDAVAKSMLADPFAPVGIDALRARLPKDPLGADLFPEQPDAEPDAEPEATPYVAPHFEEVDL